MTCEKVSKTPHLSVKIKKKCTNNTIPKEATGVPSVGSVTNLTLATQTLDVNNKCDHLVSENHSFRHFLFFFFLNTNSFTFF